MATKLTMREAVQLLGLSCDTERNSVTLVCPECEKGRRKTLNINFAKNVFRCARCGVGGGVLDLWALFKGITGPDARKEAAKDIYKQQEGGISIKPKAPRTIKAPKELDLADIDKRDKTYKAFLEGLTLSPEHRDNLISRGLDDETIKQNGYKSFPLLTLEGVSRDLLNAGNVLEGVPGFYRKGKTWSLIKMPPGILIPVRNGLNQIQGFQLRRDETTRGARYLTLSSSNRECGTPGKAFCHFREGKKGLEDIIITEGPLKADVISHFTGYSVLAVAGVNATKFLPGILSQLKRKGCKKLSIAFDMDMYSNEHVQGAFVNLKSLIEENLLCYSTLKWDVQYKGLDDWLCSQYK